MKSNSKQIEYTGKDNLDVMEVAINYNNFLTKLVLSSINSNGLVVDFGAGNGTFAKRIAADGHNVICIETDPILISDLEKAGLKVMDSLDAIPDSSVDFLYSLNVLEHIAEDFGVSKLWFRKLRPGGSIVVFVPAFQFLYTSMDRKVGHERRYTRKSLNSVIMNAGFNVNKIYYADSLGILATMLYKAMDKGLGNVNLRLLKLYDSVVFPISCALDFFLNPICGKNLVVIASKPSKTG
jgi:SAM-dependent methyltransferase